jgi:hypothetical protein
MPENIVVIDETSIYEIDAACMEKNKRKDNADTVKDSRNMTGDSRKSKR